ncbi:MAG: DNA mismatch repair endonuclease MutL, partial [bacterium]
MEEGVKSEMAAKIKLLPSTLVNQIAAGEVIVRPASVVKELVENSLDAGASQVSVELTNQCRDIKVSDDGCGMSEEDARLAVLRHSTSKIEKVEDLDHLTTRGFRGEALASIMSVARLELVTRPKESEAATKIAGEGGKVVKEGHAGAPPGTSVVIKDLFYNTPARVKFLKTPASEYGQVLGLVVRQALSAPQVGFSLTHNGRRAVDLPPDQPLKERVLALLGSSLRGKLLAVDFEREDVHWWGFVAHPEASRKDRRHQYFLVNRRPIASRTLAYSLQEAYRGVIMTGRFPVACLFVDLPEGEVDVNVHPTKEEVRFKRERLVAGLLHRAVGECLQKADLRPRIVLDKGADSKGLQAEGMDLSWEGGEEKRKHPTSRITSQSLDVPSSLAVGRKGGQARYEVPGLKGEKGVKQIGAHAQIGGSLTSNYACRGPLPGEACLQESERKNVYLAPAVVLGQVGLTYILAEVGDDLLLVDQHAAHERLVYLRLRGQDRALPSQPLFIPIMFDVKVNNLSAIESLVPVLTSVGIEVEPFGGRTFQVRSVPVDLEGLDVVGLIEDLLDESDETEKPKETDNVMDK